MQDDRDQLETVVYVLSDHLCSAIEAGDYLLALEHETKIVSQNESSESILERLDRFHRFLDDIRTYEFLIVTKINQARHWSLHLRQLDRDLRPVIDLFASSTAIVTDASHLLGQSEQQIFNGQTEPKQFIESRKICVDTTTGKKNSKICSINDHYLIGGKVLLKDLLDVCQAFHTSLEAQYGTPDRKPELQETLISDNSELETEEESFQNAH